MFLNITGASIGRSAIMKEDVEANVNQHVAIIRTNDKLIPEYLCYAINTSGVQEQINNLQTGSSRQGLNFEQIRKIKISLPHIEIQKQVVSQLDQEMESVEKIRFLKKQAEKRIQRALAEIWGEKTEENGNP